MGGRFLLDSNIVIGLLNGDEGIVRRISEADEVFINATVLGELFYGAERSSRSEENRRQIEALTSRLAVLPIDSAVSREYGVIKKVLHDKGTPVPENDIWIAATAIHHDLFLATRDAHFKEISRLKSETW